MRRLQHHRALDTDDEIGRPAGAQSFEVVGLDEFHGKDESAASGRPDQDRHTSDEVGRGPRDRDPITKMCREKGLWHAYLDSGSGGLLMRRPVTAEKDLAPQARICNSVRLQAWPAAGAWRG
ncbi:MAG: hypothetical protein Tsb008_19830 [Rhodothalassiaceae bacterium]